jgi:hypothetical protein
MGVTVMWDDDEQSIVRLNFEGDWKLDELRAIGQRGMLMMHSVDHPVCMITDFTRSKTLPLGILWQTRELYRLRPENWRTSIVITQDAIIRNLAEIFSQFYMIPRQHALFIVKTDPEARQIVAKWKQDRQVS